MDGLCNFLNSEEFYRVPKDIKSRLAKLTLSKKKELRRSLEQSLKENEQKSESTSRKSLMLQLLTDDSSESEADELNKLFKSTSFRDSDKNNKEPQQYDPDETRCSFLENIEKNQIGDGAQMNITEDMEPLQFSEVLEKSEEGISEISIHKLSQKVSNLGIYSPVKKDPAVEKSPEKTQLIAVESERKSSAGVDISSDFPPLKIETEVINKYQILKESESHTDMSILNPKIEKSIITANMSIVSLSSDNSDKESICSSDSESSGDEDIIVVSDSDEVDDCPILDYKSITKDPIGGPPKKLSDSTDNYSDQVSEIRRSGHTLLANTLSNERADRLEAFLRDLPAIGEENNFYSDNEDIQNSFIMESNKEEVQSSLFIKSNSDNVASSILIKSTDESNISNSLPEESIEIAETSAESLAKKETKVKEIVTTSYEQEPNNQKSSQEKSCQNEDAPTVEDNSPLIQETSSNKNDKSNCSTQSHTKYSSSDSSYEYEEISISAKFNIKIHIDSQPNIVINHNFNTESSRANSSNNESPSTQESRPSEIYQENQKAITQPFIVQALAEKCNQNVSVENVDENSKQILTKLYGNQWQTPENIKKLDKTLISTSKNFNNSANISKYILKSIKVEPEKSDEKNAIESNFEKANHKENSLSDNNPLAVLDKSKNDSVYDNNVENKIINKSPLEITKQLQNLNVNLENSTYDDPSIVDFSIFHKNIRNDLDSTRLHSGNIPAFKLKTNQNPEFKVPLTERKVEKNLKYPTIQRPQTEKPPIKSTRSGRKVKPVKWKQLTNNGNSSSDNDVCSDDSEADATYRGFKESSSSSQCSDGSYTKHSPSRTKKTLPKRKDCKNNKFRKNDDKLVYLDLSDKVIKVQNESKTPPAENDPSFNERLNNILKSCTFQPKKQLEVTPSCTSSKRRLFTPRFGDEDEILPPDSPLRKLQDDSQEIKLTLPLPSIFGMPINKKIESVKNGTPIFKIPTPSKSKVNETPKTSRETKENKTPKTPKTPRTPKTPKTQNVKTDLIEIEIPEFTPANKYGFLKSLDVMVPKSRCHPDALIYRDNYKIRKEELAQRLYKLYNEKLFKNELDVKIIWNKKLIKTAGRCSNKRKGNFRSSAIELSEKVLTSADRLRCTLIHELCHAATWIFNGEHGHGATWKTWAQKANIVFQELPKIGVCHSYDIEYKYTYKCIVCQAKSNAHSKSKKVENIRCAYCHGAIEIFLNKKDEEGNVIATPIKEPTGFAKFVKENYKNFQKPDLKHGDIMKILSSEFAALKVGDK